MQMKASEAEPKKVLLGIKKTRNLRIPEIKKLRVYGKQRDAK
jgi:hypothetical protein